METNKLVTTGRYELMRHPMHLGLLFLPLSIALIIGSLSFILVIAPMEMFIMILLIKVYEETEAIEKFGESYCRYQRTTPMFCLSLRCIHALFEEEQKTEKYYYLNSKIFFLYSILEDDPIYFQNLYRYPKSVKRLLYDNIKILLCLK